MAADSFLTRLYRRFARTIHTRQLTADAFPLHVWHLSLGLPGEITGNEILSLSAARPPETCYVSIRERVRAGGLDTSCMVSESVYSSVEPTVPRERRCNLSIAGTQIHTGWAAQDMVCRVQHLFLGFIREYVFMNK